MGHVDRAEPRHLLGRVAEHPQGAGRDVAELAVQPDPHDHVVGVFGDEAVVLLALQGLGLRALHLGDVGEHADAGPGDPLLVPIEGAAGHHVADVAIGADDANLDGRVPAGVLLLVQQQSRQVFRVTEAVQGRDVGGV